MKKLAGLLVLLVVFSLVTSLAYADIFGERGKKLKAGEEAVSLEPDTILDNLSTIIGYLGAREGTFYDFNTNEFCNYAGVTIYTYKPWGVSLGMGALNLDGGAATIDWNAGAFIPSEEVPVLSLFKYLYVGAGGGARYLGLHDDFIDEREWQFAYGLNAQFKMTY